MPLQTLMINGRAQTPRQYASCDCLSKSSCTRRNIKYNSTIVFSQADCTPHRKLLKLENAVPQGCHSNYGSRHAWH